MNGEGPVLYEDLRFSAPENIRMTQGKRKLHIWQVLLFFGFVMAVFLTIGGLLQSIFGMLGVLFCQLGFLVFSICFVKLMRADPRAVFPLHRPRALGLLGVAVCWVGVFFASEVISFLLLLIAPGNLLEISDSMVGLLGSGSTMILSVLVVSIAPAICEEALHRGVILNGFQNDLPGQKWPVILFCGLIFGLFHVYPVRILPTALIGCILAYLMTTTGNMVYSCFLHLFHNGMLMLLQLAASSMAGDAFTQQSAELITSLPRGLFGVYIALFGVPAPILIYTGCYLVRRATAPARPRFIEPAERRRTLFWILFPAVASFLLGVFILIAL